VPAVWASAEKSFISNLSGGEKQRVAIARALAQDPEVLFCDEATSSLDPKTTGEILDLLHDLNKNLGLTLVLITHEMDVVRRICNKVAVMSQGRVVEYGSSLEVFSAPKDEVTKGLMQNSTHMLDLTPLREKEPEALFLTLHFKGEVAENPILSSMIKELDIEVNILSGWIDQIDFVSVGSLTIGVRGKQRVKVFSFLEERGVSYEVLSSASS
jgi:D-methionine transport system ATP-binding protein